MNLKGYYSSISRPVGYLMCFSFSKKSNCQEFSLSFFCFPLYFPILPSFSVFIPPSNSPTFLLSSWVPDLHLHVPAFLPYTRSCCYTSHISYDFCFFFTRAIISPTTVLYSSFDSIEPVFFLSIYFRKPCSAAVNVS